jgi:hypothetical protein
MAFIPQTSTTIFCRTKLTDLGKQYLVDLDETKRKKFNLSKFAFGDSEIDYSLLPEQIAGNTAQITSPSPTKDGITSMVYYINKILDAPNAPTRNSELVLSTNELVISRNQSFAIHATTFWPNKKNKFYEKYTWENLGPFKEINLTPINDTQSVTVKLGAGNGGSGISARGMTTGLKAILYIYATGDTINVVTVLPSGDTIPPPPDAPIPLTPASGSTYTTVTSAGTLTFDWTTVSTAAYYYLQVATDSGFTTLYLDKPNLLDSNYPVTTGMANQQYYWRVKCSDIWGQTSNWSSSFTYTHIVKPDRPVLLSIGSGSTAPGGRPRLDWADTFNAYRYDLYVDTSTGFGSANLVELTDLISSVYQFSSSELLIPWWTGSFPGPSWWYWRVQAKNTSSSKGAFSEYWSFFSPGLSPSVPTLSSPANGYSMTASSLTLQWNSAACATTYDIQVDNNSDFSSPFISVTGIAVTSYLASGFTLGTYYWRVRGVNSINTSSWSSSRNFYVYEDAPEAPTLITPADDTLL